MVRTGWILGTFFTMYLVATVLGFATYLLLSPLAMWIAVFTLMPLVSAALIYLYLRQTDTRPAASLRESLRLMAVWILLSFALDAFTYVAVVPRLHHAAPNYTFFRDQSPWIWLSYPVLMLSALAAHTVYRKTHHA